MEEDTRPIAFRRYCTVSMQFPSFPATKGIYDAVSVQSYPQIAHDTISGEESDMR